MLRFQCVYRHFLPLLSTLFHQRLSGLDYVSRENCPEIELLDGYGAEKIIVTVVQFECDSWDHRSIIFFYVVFFFDCFVDGRVNFGDAYFFSVDVAVRVLVFAVGFEIDSEPLFSCQLVWAVRIILLFFRGHGLVPDFLTLLVLCLLRL